jgi:hypothetical protein
MSADPENDQQSPQPPTEVEVERLAPLSGGESQPKAPKRPKVGAILGPVLAGVVIDVIDLATPVPLIGMAAGWPLGAYVARRAGASPSTALLLGLMVGLYCAVPMTAGLPIATLVGTVVKVRGALKES